MKSKHQKRLEAIERLERQPRWLYRTPEPPSWIQETWARRMEEAKRLRRCFGLTSSTPHTENT